MKNTLTLLAICAALRASAGTVESVAAVLIAEAGGEGAAGLQGVANVIANRAAASGVSRLTVITAPRQFSCLSGVSLARLESKARLHPLWPKAVALASAKRLPDITRGANHYHEASVSPKWAKSSRKTATIGRHLFYRL